MSLYRMARVYEKQGTSASTTNACVQPTPWLHRPKRATLQQEMRNAPLQYIILEYKQHVFLVARKLSF
jgi:hypothetical protein